MAKATIELEGIKKTEQYLTNLFKARFSFVYIPTWEEIRVVELITKIANNTKAIKSKRDVFIWSSTEGLNKVLTKGQEKVNINNAENPSEALSYIDGYNKPAIMILKDVHPLLGMQGRNADYTFIRKIRDVAGSLKNAEFSKNVVILAPTLVLPNDLQKDITVVDFDLPTLEELKSLLNEMIEMNEGSGILIDLDENGKEVLCKAAQGLTLQEAENSFARAMVTKGQLTVKELDIILEEKCQVIKKTGILEFINTKVNIDDVGGLENMKRWLTKRNNSWLGSAQKDYNLPSPKGILITGVPGCGKSMTAKAMSAMWQLPLLRLDVGKIFSGLVGSSEENMRKAIQTAEAVAPSILWIDEIEKGFSGAGSEMDGGTSTRVFGTFLTWLNEKTKPVFVIATANNINRLPSEMLRKGRFDEIFFVDLPTVNERKIIFKLHLEKRLKGSKSKDFDISEDLLNRLAQSTEGFGGSEIEQVVVSALFEAFAENRTLEEKDLFKVIENAVPLSTTQSEQILAIREWANERAVAATAHDENYNYVPEETEETAKKKAKAKKTTETIKRTRGGRTIEF
ncbi:MAG: AAA family ATPase [Candidatus Gastranaerophilales bacterium]|nr:AAA family ATPase [Candidatus Gastranaerophilales bacterium]